MCIGEHVKKKQDNTIQLIFQNIDGIPRGEAGEWKLKVMQQFLMEIQADIFGFTESNTCWEVILYQERLPICMQGWWETAHLSLWFNWLEKYLDAYQPGQQVFWSWTYLLIRNQVQEPTHLALGGGVGFVYKAESSNMYDWYPYIDCVRPKGQPLLISSRFGLSKKTVRKPASGSHNWSHCSNKGLARRRRQYNHNDRSQWRCLRSTVDATI